MPGGKHLTVGERARIEAGLAARETLGAIARGLGRSASTVSGEILARREARKTGALGARFNDCALRRACGRRGVCGNGDCGRRCSLCPGCADLCGDYEKEPCPLLLMPPYACNGCAARSRCTLEKRVYSAKSAQGQYERTLRSERSGPNIEPAELARVNAIVAPLIRKGQSIHHIFAAHKGEIMLSEKTVYNYIDQGLLGVDNLDLPRKVRLRPRRLKKPRALKVEGGCRAGRTYADFPAFAAANPDIPVAQMDSVEGRKGGKVLLTVHFVVPKLMLIFLRDANTAKSVEDCFGHIYAALGHDKFAELFQILVTDNGSEFSAPSAIELAPDGRRRARVFFCDPGASFQKGAIENNHELIRKVVPKGRPLDGYTQGDMLLLASHINALRKKALGDRTPYEVFEFLYGGGVLEKLGLSKVGGDSVILKPSLLGHGRG
jgi:IS30 family transposase